MNVLISVLVGLLTKEFRDVSPWLATKLVRWAARHQHRHSRRAEIRAEEWASVVADRPGNLFKLFTAVTFAIAAVVNRAASRHQQPRRQWRLLLPRFGRGAARVGLAALVTILTESFICLISRGGDVPSSLIFIASIGGAAAVEAIVRLVPSLPIGVLSSLFYTLVYGDHDLRGFVTVYVGMSVAQWLLTRRKGHVIGYAVLTIAAMTTWLALDWSMFSGTSSTFLLYYDQYYYYSYFLAFFCNGLIVGLGVAVAYRRSSSKQAVIGAERNDDAREESEQFDLSGPRDREQVL